MDNSVKFVISQTYFYFVLLVTLALFLLDTYFLMFEEPAARDIPPMVLFDMVYLAVLILYAKKYTIFVADDLTMLELNEHEIIDHNSNVRVKWSNVSDIRFKSKGSSSYISIDVMDKKEVYLQTKNIFKKFSFYLTTLLTGTPIRILLISIKGDNLAIFIKINKFFKERKLGADIG